ncbi:MAG TPA: nuclear transport factor 2 family protein [Candidatus Eisenbacteria bacterium]|nr:nuclear transport factor 2 family protein [Candidatus Eisenbacteria bacterium]
MHELETPEAAAVAAALARALDADDFATVRSLLADGCVYETGREVHRGPEAIVGSYAGASAWARRAFDEVRYASEIAPATGAEVTVTFTDYLLKAGGRWHRHRCRQTFTVSGGRVARIVHHEIEGEREALDAYFRECGIER